MRGSDSGQRTERPLLVRKILKNFCWWWDHLKTTHSQLEVFRPCLSLWRDVCPAQRYIWRNEDTSTSSSYFFCGSSALPLLAHNLLLKVEWIKQNLLVLQTLEVGGNPEILYSMSTTSRQLSWLSSAFSLIFELWCTFSGIIVENKTSHDYQSQPIFTISFRYIPNIGIHEGLRMCIIINDKSARWNTADIRKNLLIKPL